MAQGCDFSVCETLLFGKAMKCVSLKRGSIVSFEDFRYPVAKMHFNAGMVSFAVVLGTIATSGYLEYASKTTRTISPVGNRPQKSADGCNYGPFGVGDIFRGSRWELLVLAWQDMQVAIFLSRFCQFLVTIPLIAGAAWLLQFQGALHGRC